MPKKKRKSRPRHRQNPNRRPEPKPAPPVPVDLPRDAQEPLVRLEFSPQAKPEDIERAIRYWTPEPDGGWTEPVAPLGSPSKVATELKQVCQAYLLHQLCRGCAAPLRATSRSDAVAMAGHDLRRNDRSFLCQACRHAQEQRQAEEDRAAQERAQALEEVKKASLAGLIERESAAIYRHHRRDSELSADMACVLAAMVNRTRTTGVIPARNTLSTGWMTQSAHADIDILVRLYQAKWIVVSPSASQEHVAFDDEGQVKGLYPGIMPFRLATSVEDTREDMTAMLLAHSKDKHLSAFQRQIELMEAHSLFRYLDSLLADKYQYPPVPENKVTDLYTHFFDGLQDYTFGQMVCFVWRAADTAAGWKERKQLTDAHASSAVVTILKNKLDTARECKSAIPEYTLPRSHEDPPALAAAHALVRELQEYIATGYTCELHEDGPLPCAPCLGMLYAGGEDAEEIREHYALLGDSAVRLRPDLATKPQISPAR